jgi:CheY-like chemotaxis protein
MHILLIDDSSSTRSLLRTLINSGQTVRHEISEAASGEEALQKVGSGEINLPDLIIMDINMGGMSGFELCREFRQRHGTASDVVPYIIIVTANEGVDVINEALDCGANDYMPKPVNVKILHIRLRVAERLLAQAHAGTGLPGTSRLPVVANGGTAPVAAQPSFIGSAVEKADAPVTLIEVNGANSTFNIAYANEAMKSMAQAGQGPLEGKSLSELEAWTPEFIDMILGFIGRGAIISYVPLWSKIRQVTPVHLSFYPILTDSELITHYLVIHQL